MISPERQPQSVTLSPSSFTAYPNLPSYYDNEQVIIFDRTLINLGNNYQDNIYIAPVNGLYLMSLSLTSAAGYRMEAAIVKNGEPLVEAMNYDMSTYHSASNMVLAELLVGDALWVQAIGDGNRLDAGTHSTFSGVLLHEYSETS